MKRNSIQKMKRKMKNENDERKRAEKEIIFSLEYTY